MNSIVLEISTYAGTDICTLIKEAKILAESLPISAVKFTFNGVNMLVSRNSNVEYEYELYLKSLGF